MPPGIRLKTIAVACILVLIVGIINHDRVSAGRIAGATVSAASTGTAGIESDFFDFRPPARPAASASSSISADESSPGSARASAAGSPASTTTARSPASAPRTPADIITADSYLVGNLETGQIYLQKAPGTVRPIASISKLLVALIVTGQMAQDPSIAITASSTTGFEQPGDVRPGEAFAVQDLLTGMLLISSNDAATAFADAYGYDAFVNAINGAAASLGMTSTGFQDPSGLSPGNVSTASDLFKLARYLYQSQPAILAITRTPEFDVATTTAPAPAHGSHDFVNIDPFVYDPHYIGGKTGNTDQAGETMLSLFNLPVNGVNYPVAIIVLHSDPNERQIDSSILLERALSAISGHQY